MTGRPDELFPSTYAGPIPSHPARWTPAILDRVAALVAPLVTSGPDLFGDVVRVLDPCAGVGGIHSLTERLAEVGPVETVGVDIQPEWAAADRRTLVGDSTALPLSWAGRFAAVATSVTYPNRMTDHHEAKDPCKPCAGTGCAAGEACADAPASVDLARGAAACAHLNLRCPKCKGSGLSRRNTYRHRLDEVGAKVAPGSAVVLGWKSATQRRRYQRLHAAILEEAARVLVPYGRLLLNVSNHIEDDVEQRVVEWYLEHLLNPDRPTRAGTGELTRTWALDAIIPIATPRNRNGANGDLRAEHEFLLALHRRY